MEASFLVTSELTSVSLLWVNSPKKGIVCLPSCTMVVYMYLCFHAYNTVLGTICDKSTL